MIKSLKIKNFKSVIDETIALPTFGAIVGLNGAGKTNLLHAIDLVKSLVIGLELEIIQARMSTIPNEMFNLKDKHASKSFTIQLEIESENSDTYTFSVTISKSNSTEFALVISEEEFCKKNGSSYERIYRRDEKGTIYQQNGDPLPFVMGVDKLFATVYDHPDVEVCRNFFKETRIIHFDSASLRHPRLVMVGGAVRADALSRLITRLMKQETLYKDFLKIIKGLMPNFSDFKELSLEGDKKKGEQKEILLLLQESSLQSDLTTRAMSEGDIRTLYIIATALDMARNSTLMIEEVENGMHPQRITKLIDHLDTFSKAKNMQIVFSTHNPSVINKLGPEHVLFVEKDEHGSHFSLLKESEEISQIKEILKDGGRLSDYLSKVVR